MLSRYGVLASTLVLLSTLTACDSVNTGNADNVLTQQESDALFKVIATGFETQSTDSVLEPATRRLIMLSTPPHEYPSPSDEDLKMAIDSRYACSGGGSVSVVGTVTLAPEPVDQDKEAVLQYDLARYATDCVVTTEDVTFHLDVYYGMREQGQVRFSTLEDEGLSFVFEKNGTTTGTITWATADRSGACKVDLSTTELTESALFGPNADASGDMESPTRAEDRTSGNLCDIVV